MKKSKLAFLQSAVALLLCVSMLLGSTWAWFTDTVESTNNIIQSGTLDAKLFWNKDNGTTWEDASEGAIFDYKHWEPGYTDIKYVKIENAGSLAFRYCLNIIPEVMPTAGAINLSDVIDVYVIENPTANLTRVDLADMTPVGTLTDLITDPEGAANGVILPAEGKGADDAEEIPDAAVGTTTYCIALKMQETAGNEYQDKTVGGSFRVQLLATQYTYENDSFGNDYDADSEWPVPGLKENVTGSTTVTAANGKVSTEATIETSTDVSATIPAGVAVNDGVSELTLSVSEKTTSESNITAGETEELMALDVHVEGVSADNTTPIIVNLGAILPVGLNSGNVSLYHVENGSTVAMTRVATLAELDEHNEFYYDPATGITCVAMATFSEVTVVADTENAWEGAYDYTWYDASKTEFTIANADQLAGFGKIVGGMADGIVQDSFTGETITLISDINLGDKNNASESLIFHPIGYYYTDDKDSDGTTGDYYSTVCSFEGTFDGNGHTIANFYQNTWEIKGDYDGNYYKDGMGLFGYVVGGTVRNLTVDNFSSDGEFTPTGVIAAYAVNSAFENIAITNCNPRVYNTGNGGIVGIGGNTSDTEDAKLTFTNITIDNTNIISALWGSWDVACGGLVGMFRGDGHVYMTNCHVAAQIDVYNDVCGNYQYYWYRYSGMMIGTNKNMTTDANGYTVPETDKFHAENCTVHFGDWNDYYYCELVANTLASYTHDHQFSRLTQIQNVSEIQDENGNWNKTGNYLLISGETKTCYHIVNKDGTLTQHLHTDAGEETVNGETVLKEDKQIVYLPFNQLFTGYGWGVKHVPIYDDGKSYFEGITILGRETANSVEKFKGKVEELANNKEYKLGDIFNFVNNGVDPVPGALTVTVTNLDDTNPVSATVEYNRTTWGDSTITFTGSGDVQITIQDYYFCTPTTINVTVTDRQPEKKFEVAFDHDSATEGNQNYVDTYLYRVGNSNAVALSSLFEAKEGASIGTVSVTVEAVDGTAASGAYTANASDWTKGTILFSGTGVVKVTITDNDYCTPTVLYLEVVDAVNATSATNATSNNVVLLNDISSGFTVSGRYTVYGNGFTLNYTGNGQYLNNGLKQGVVTVSENGTLDNLRIVASIYPAAYLYYEEAKKGPSTVEGDKTRYHYQLSAVAATGNATIQNCYIYGGRTNIYIGDGNVTVRDSVLECGALANSQIVSSSDYTVTFEDVTTIQHQINATIGETSNVMFGAGILVGDGDNENTSATAPAIVLTDSLKQYNWVTKDDEEAVSDSNAKMIIGGALNATEYNHIVNGKTATNLGIIFLNNLTVNVTNNTGLPYAEGTVSLSLSGMNVIRPVYSLKSAKDDQIYSDYENADKTTVNGLYQPQFKYSSDLGGQYIAKTDDGDEHCYREGDTIKVMFPSGNTKELDLAGLVNIAKYTGQNLNLVVACKDENGNAVAVTDGKITLSIAGEYTVTYTVTDTLFYDKEGNKVSGSETYSWDVTVSVSLKDAAVPNAYFEFNADSQKMGYYVKSSLFSTSVYQYLPFLAGLKIYDYIGQTSYLRFDGDNDFSKVASIEVTNKYSGNDALVVVKLTDGGVITLQLLARADSGGGSTYTGSIKTSGNTIYFVNDGTTSESEATTTAAYWYVDYYKFTGNNGVEITSAQQTFNSTGSSASTPSGSFSTTINYTVSYDANGGNCGQTTGYATSVSSAVTLPTPTRSGYIFAGWYTAASGGTRVGGAGDSYTPSANVTLYAQWSLPCTVTYEANGGSCTTTSAKYTGTALTLPTATRDGYWFSGWYDAATEGNKIGDAGVTYTPSGDITLYAHWQEKVEYTVTYNANDGICDTASATYQGTALILPTPTQTGYKFLGWYDETTGGNKIGDAGATYTPSANITLYAQWEKIAYTITVTTENATVSGVTNGQTAYYGDTITFTVTYSKNSNKTTKVTDASGNTVTTTGSYTFTMPASNVTISASSEDSCVTPDTLITLADGTQKEIQYVTHEDELLVWDFDQGEYTVVNSSIIENHGYDINDVIKLTFEDGTTIKVVNVHGFFDADLNKWVDINAENAQSFVEHSFTQVDGDSYKTVKLVSAEVTTEYIEAWSILTVDHYNCIMEGMFSITPPATLQLAIFEIGDGMKYDAEAKQADIEKYGLYTYDEFAHLMTEEQFDVLNVAEIKIAVGKGLITYEEVLWLIATYAQN